MIDTSLHAVSLVVHDHDTDQLPDISQRFEESLTQAGLSATSPTVGVADYGYVLVSFVTVTADHPESLLPMLAVSVSDLTPVGTGVELTARRRPLPFLDQPSKNVILLNPHGSAPEEWFLFDRAHNDVNAQRVFLLPTGPASLLDDGTAAIQTQPGWYTAVSFEYGCDKWDDVRVDLRVRGRDGMAPEECSVQQDFTEWVISLWESRGLTPDDLTHRPWEYTVTASLAVATVL